MGNVWVQSLPFEKVQHQIATLDAQPSSEQGGILVMVTGALLVRTALRCWARFGCALTCFVVQVDQEQKPMSYTQSFQLLPDGQGSYFVFNDIFRLIYAAAT